MMRGLDVARIAVLITAPALVACQDAGTAPDAGRERPAYQILDAAHDAAANPDFFFLPPLVPDPSGDANFDAGAFDATISPAVEVCQADATGCLPQQTDGFPIASGSDAMDAVSVSAADQQYRVNWHTDLSPLNPDVTYRIRVLVAGAELGFADLDVVSGGGELKNVQTDEYIPLLDGRTLPIKFRIEQGAVTVIGTDGGTVSAMDGVVTLVLPPGAVSVPTGITILRGVGYPADPDLVAGSVFDLGPNGTDFAAPVLLTIRYDPASIPTAGDESDLVLSHLVDGMWTEVAGSSVDLTAHAVSGPVTGFSLYAVRYRPPPPPLNAPLVFQSARDGDNEIFRYDGTTVTQLTDNTVADDAPDWIGGRITWSSRVSGNYDIWVMDEDGGSPTNITNSTGSSEFGPKWSPCGCRIAFLRRMPAGNYDVWVMNADGSNQVNLTNHPANDVAPAWSPDGDRLVFTSDRDGNRELYVMSADGSGTPTRATDDPDHDDASAEFNADGTQIVFSKYVAGTSGEIWIVDADGNNPHAVTTSPTLDYGPAWSPDGSQIAFERYSSLIGGQTDIWLVNPDGTGLHSVVASPAGDGAAAWQRPAPPEFTSQAVQLTSGADPGYFPRLGADAAGDIAVFVSDVHESRKVWYQRLNRDGTPRGEAVMVDEGFLPDISGSRVVYEQSLNEEYRVMLYDIATGARSTIAASTVPLTQPRIDGEGVIWTEGDAPPRLLYFDLTWDPSTPPVEIGVAGAAVGSIDIGSRYVVWQAGGDNQGDIVAYDRDSGDDYLVSSDPTVLESWPAVSGSRVVWMAGAGIRLADLSEQPIVVRTLVDVGRFPGVDGELVTFARNDGIYVYRLADDRTFQASPPAGTWHPDVYRSLVTYGAIAASGTYEVFVSRLRFGCDVACTGCGGP